MAGRKKVLVTGAAGRIGQAIMPELVARWDVVQTDIRADGADGADRAAVTTLDVTDLAACRAACEGVDAVVHLAGNPSPSATWDELLAPNVIGTQVIAQASMDAGVARLVLASSAQAVAGYLKGRQIRAEDPPRPDNLYGATKAWAEAIGSWVAASSSTTVVALRIGRFSEEPLDPAETTPRDLAAFLSVSDCARLVIAAVEATGIQFVVGSGISNNRYPHLDLITTRQRLGYEPVDDAWA